MKFMDWIERRPVMIGFDGRGGIPLDVSVGANNVVLDLMGTTVPAATGISAGILTATDKAKLDGLQNTTVAVDPADLTSRAQLIATSITDPQLLYVRTAGFTTPGDGGGATYVRAASEPGHPGKVQSADGTWWEYAPGPEGINVRALGAADNADSTQPFRDALMVADTLQSSWRYVSSNPSGTYTGTWDMGLQRIFIPAGTYQIDLSSGHLWDLAPYVAFRGLSIVGAGVDQTFIRITGGLSKHVLHNDNDGRHITMQGLSVHDETRTASNLFAYMRSTGNANRLYLTDIYTEHMAVYLAEGTGNADHFRAIRVVAEDVPNGLSAYKINNPQAVDNVFFGCELVNLAGKGVEIDAGGNLNWFGGSVVLVKGGRFIDIDGAGSSIGSGNNSFDFHGPRIEMRDAGTGSDPEVLYLDAVAAVNFFGGAYQVDETSGTRSSTPYTINRGRFQVHASSNWGETHTVTINAADGDNSLDLPPEFAIHNSHLKAQLSDLVTITEPPASTGRHTSFGRAYARGCFGADNAPVDCAINASHGQRPVSIEKKRAYFTSGQSANGTLPANGSPLICNIPVGAIVARVGFTKKSGSGSGGVTYSWSDGNGATLWTDGSPVNNGQSVTHFADLSPEFEVMDSTAGTFAFENITASAAAASGYAFVEYY